MLANTSLCLIIIIVLSRFFQVVKILKTQVVRSTQLPVPENSRKDKVLLGVKKVEYENGKWAETKRNFTRSQIISKG